jgi:hypothetical protein
MGFSPGAGRGGPGGEDFFYLFSPSDTNIKLFDQALFGSVGCSARSLGSNHVPQLVVDDFT